MPAQRSRPGRAGCYDLPSKKTALQMAADAIREARESSGQSQSQVAQKAGTSQNQIWRLERGRMRRGPTLDLLDRVATAVGRRVTLTID